MATPLAITGIGCIGAPGSGLAAQCVALRSGTCGLSLAQDPALPLAAQVPVARVHTGLPTGYGRTAALGLVAAREALLSLPPALRRDLGLIVGTCTGGMRESEAHYLTTIATSENSPISSPIYRQQPAASVTTAIATALGIRGPRSTHSVACASAASAIAEAAEWLRSSLVERVLVIGTDALTRLTLGGFASLQVIDPQGCRPLTRERAGMNLGEGAGALLLELPRAAHARGAQPLASLLGWGLRADAHHPTAPHPEGVHLELAIRDALHDACLAPTAIDYVSAHGTGTHDNDACEASVLARVFGAIPTASCKRIYGHSMGASAAIEAVVSCLALIHGQRWLSSGVELGTAVSGIAVQRTTVAGNMHAVCSTSLAFGGVNAALIFGTGASCR